MSRHQGANQKGQKGQSISAARIAARVAELGRTIGRAYDGRRVDVVITERGFMFAADLIRHIDSPVVSHFVRADMRDVHDGEQPRREITFGAHPELQGRDVLLVDAVLESGVVQEFLLRRLGEGRPRSLRLAVLLDKPHQRKVELEPDYFGFRTASNGLWVGYGLAAPTGMGGNQKGLSMRPSEKGLASRKARKPAQNS